MENKKDNKDNKDKTKLEPKPKPPSLAFKPKKQLSNQLSEESYKARIGGNSILVRVSTDFEDEYERMSKSVRSNGSFFDEEEVEKLNVSDSPEGIEKKADENVTCKCPKCGCGYEFDLKEQQK